MGGLLVKVGFAIFVAVLLLWALSSFLDTSVGSVVKNKVQDKLDKMGWNDDPFADKEDKNGNNHRH